jgi:transposase
MQVLTDAQWSKFEAAIAAAGIRGGRPRKDDRQTIEAIIWRLDNGAKWRSIPAELGEWHHVYLRFRRWTLAGVWDRILAHLSSQGVPSSVLPASMERSRGRIRKRLAHAGASPPANKSIESATHVQHHVR